MFYEWQCMIQPHTIQRVFIGRAHVVFYIKLYIYNYMWIAFHHDKICILLETDVVFYPFFHVEHILLSINMK